MGEKNKIRFDENMKAAELVPGDRVVKRNLNIRGKQKLANCWEQNIHIVVKQKKESETRN